MARDGYILLHRCLIDKPIWFQSTPEQKVILITLLLMANHSQKEWIWEGKKFEVEPGQFITSLDNIAKKAGVSIKNVRTAIAKFENLEFLANQSTKTGRLITVVNWHTYQVKMRDGGKANGKEVAKDRQRGGKEVATNKNDKECKNDKNVNIIENYTTNIELIKAINGFIMMRNSIKKQITENALNLMLGKLNKLANTDEEKIEILNQSIMNSYQGIFPVKKNGFQQTSKFDQQSAELDKAVAMINATRNGRQGNQEIPLKLSQQQY